jgi:hypothetical protein
MYVHSQSWNLHTDHTVGRLQNSDLVTADILVISRYLTEAT